MGWEEGAGGLQALMTGGTGAGRPMADMRGPRKGLQETGWVRGARLGGPGS